MTRDHAAECMRLEAEWRKTRSGHTGELSAEQRAMQRAFAHFRPAGTYRWLHLRRDKLVAFTYGSPINDHTFCVHVEKADTEYDGAFTIINREFVAHLPSNTRSSTAKRTWVFRDYGRPSSPTIRHSSRRNIRPSASTPTK